MRTVKLLLCALCMLLTSGCVSIYSNYRDVGELHLIQALGFDSSGEGVRLTIDSGRSGESGSTVMSIGGASVTDAIGRMQMFSVHEDMNYAHAGYAVIGSALAEDDLELCLDFFLRSVQIRMDVGLMVLHGGEAGELITLSAGEGSSASEMLSSIDRVASREGTSHVFTYQETMRALVERGAALMCAIETEDTEGVVFSDSGEKAAVARGYAVVVGTRVESWLLGEDARGVDLLLGLGGGGTTVVTAGALTATVGLRSEGCSIEPVWSPDGHLEAIEVKSRLNCSVPELPGGGAIGPEMAAEIERAVEKKAEHWLRETLALTAKYGADCLGLDGYVRRAAPEEFAAVEDNWAGELAGAEMRVSVSAGIDRDYDMRSGSD